MSKRAASDYLTHDNWNKDSSSDEERDDPGLFKSASEEIIRGRIIKRARRTCKEGEASNKKNAFAGFSFGVSSSNNSNNTSSANTSSFTAPSFAVSQTSTATQSQTMTTSTTEASGDKRNSNETKVSQSTSADVGTKLSGGFKVPEVPPPAKAASPSKMYVTKKCDNPEDEYLKQMKHLNESFIKWISENVAKCPSCILTPTFADYNKYVAEIDKDFPSQDSVVEANDVPKTTTAVSSSFLTSTSTATSAPLFNFGWGSVPVPKRDEEVKNSTQSEENMRKPPFAFGSFNFGTTNQTAGVPAFNFMTNKTEATSAATANQEKDSAADQKLAEQENCASLAAKSDSTIATTCTTSTLPKFSFNTNTPFSFGSGSSFPNTFGQGFFSKPPTGTATGESDQTGVGGGDDEEYEPPKADVVETEEEGSFFKIRCKLYYKKAEKFQERGLGFLHLKPNGTKTQLIIRTDTALGNILLNINMDKMMPVSRQGVNNVTVVCVPNPPVDSNNDSNIPIPTLIRVKTKDEADELFKQLTECQAKM